MNFYDSMLDKHYENALSYATALEYKAYVDSFNKMLPVIKEAWATAL